MTDTSTLLPESDEDQNAKPERPKTAGGSKQKTSRSGSLKHSTADIAALLDFVEALKPLEANHWAEVDKNFEQWAAGNERPKRD